MSDAYNVRYDGQRYWVYRIDGNVAVGEFLNASEAQRSAAVRNQQHNEMLGKKKDSQALAESEPSTPSEPSTAPEKTSSKDSKEVPDPPKGQGASF